MNRPFDIMNKITPQKLLNKAIQANRNNTTPKDQLKS